MANELTVTGLISYLNATKGITVAKLLGTNPTVQVTVSGQNYFEGTQVIPTTAGGTALNKGGVGTLGSIIIFNRDPTNYVQLLNAVSGTALIRIYPNGMPAMFQFDPGITAPAMLANTSSVTVEYLLIEA